MPAGANAKREAEYRKIERKFKKEGRYKGREEEVAARIVNQQRAAKGETQAATHTPPRRSASRRKTRTSRTAARRK
jgi:phage-related minor tail protein